MNEKRGTIFGIQNSLIEYLALDLNLKTDTLRTLGEREIYTLDKLQRLSKATLIEWGVETEDIAILEKADFGRGQEEKK